MLTEPSQVIEAGLGEGEQQSLTSAEGAPEMVEQLQQ